MSEHHTYRYMTDWQRLDAADAAAIRAFWASEGARVEGEEATRRLAQVVAHVLDGDRRIAAVATAVPRVLPRLGQPLYYYRCFVGKAWRHGFVIRPLLRLAQDVLERHARERGYPCIGMLLELENQGFAESVRQACWPSGFAYIGRSPRGLDLRAWYFRGARLKTPGELALLLRESG